MSELKNCPFCSKQMRKKKMVGNITGFYCLSCGAIVSFSGSENDEPACEHFNTRTALPRFTAAEREAMEELMLLAETGKVVQRNEDNLHGSGAVAGINLKFANTAISTVRAMLTDSEIADKGKG